MSEEGLVALAEKLWFSNESGLMKDYHTHFNQITIGYDFLFPVDESLEQDKKRIPKDIASVRSYKDYLLQRSSEIRKHDGVDVSDYEVVEKFYTDKARQLDSFVDELRSLAKNGEGVKSFEEIDHRQVFNSIFKITEVLYGTDSEKLEKVRLAKKRYLKKFGVSET